MFEFQISVIVWSHIYVLIYSLSEAFQYSEKGRTKEFSVFISHLAFQNKCLFNLLGSSCRCLVWKKILFDYFVSLWIIPCLYKQIIVNCSGLSIIALCVVTYLLFLFWSYMLKSSKEKKETFFYFPAVK